MRKKRVYIFHPAGGFFAELRKTKTPAFLLLFLFLFPASAFAASEGFSVKELAIQIFNFSIFFTALIFLTRKPLGAFFHKRQKDFISFEEQAIHLEKERQREKKEWGEKLTTLEKQEQGIQQKAQTEGERWFFQKKEELKSLKIRLQKEADFLIHLEKEKAKRELLQQWKDKVIQSAQQDLKNQSQSHNFQSERVKDFFKQMEDRL